METARIIAYLAGVAAGLFAFVYGVMTNEWELIATGAGLMGLGGLAGFNVPSVTKARHGSQD